MYQGGACGSGWGEDQQNHRGNRGGWRGRRGRHYSQRHGNRDPEDDNHGNRPRRGGKHQRQHGSEKWGMNTEKGEIETDSRHMKERPPPGLRGRAIGMWYAQHSRGKTRKLRQEMMSDVSLGDGKRREISQLLHGIQTSRECPPQPDRYRRGRHIHPRIPSASSTSSLDQGFQDIDVKDEIDMDFQDFKVKVEMNQPVADVKVKKEIIMSDQPDSMMEDPEPYFDMKADFIPLQTESHQFDAVAGTEVEFDEGDDSDVEEVKELLQYNEEEEVIYISSDEEDERFGQFGRRRSQAELNTLNRLLEDDLQSQQETLSLSREQKQLLATRQKLPSHKYQQEIADLISSNQVVVLSGETGCGKTTQVPQYILDDYIRRGKGAECNIICTQPRRISAISVAERVAAERLEPLGESVGYIIRLENKLPRDYGSILYCTTGIVLKMLEGDRTLSRATHIILDEIHERDILSDFLIIILKDLLRERPDLKVILMSATLSAKDFSKYYENCPMYHIPGFMYPVKEYLLEDVIDLLQYHIPDQMLAKTFRGKTRFTQQPSREDYNVWLRMLESGSTNQGKRYNPATIHELEQRLDVKKTDKDLIVELIRHIHFKKQEGAILVFVPGWGEISEINKMLLADQAFKSGRTKIIPLHSMMPTVNQKDIFERPPPGVRKIVIATSIAETSITIDDIVYVIDSGKIKTKGFNAESYIDSLNVELVTTANSKQRRGRAGRVQAGECYHLYTGYDASVMEPYQKPEILRTRLEELCLQIRNLKLGKIVPFLSKAMEAPPIMSVEKAIVTLQNLNALDHNENLLPLGKHLARMPLDPHSGKMILFGAMFGCLDPILTVVASLNFKEPFLLPLERKADAQQRKMTLAEECASDHILLVKTFNLWKKCWNRGTSRQFCWDNFLSESTLKMLMKMREQLAEILEEMGFIDSFKLLGKSANIHSNNEELVKAIVCAGLYPNVANVHKFATKHSSIKFHTKDQTKCELHPGSVAKILNDPKDCWVVYHKMMKTTGVFVYDCSAVSPYSLLFFGGDISQTVENGENMVCVDEWIKFKCSPDTVRLVQDLRRELDSVLNEKFRKTSATDWSPNSKEGAVLRAIIDLVASNQHKTKNLPAGQFTRT